jgi:DNA-binding beta-propeller fold protein YncE
MKTSIRVIAIMLIAFGILSGCNSGEGGSDPAPAPAPTTTSNPDPAPIPTPVVTPTPEPTPATPDPVVVVPDPAPAPTPDPVVPDPDPVVPDPDPVVPDPDPVVPDPDPVVPDPDPAAYTMSNTTVGKYPSSISFDSSGNAYVANGNSSSVTKLTSTGTFVWTKSVGNTPNALTADDSDNIWVANYSDNTVSKISSTGIVTGPFSSGGVHPIDIAWNSTTSTLWVINRNDNNVREIDPADGSLIGTAHAVGLDPVALTVDDLGNIWVANHDDDSVTKLDPDGAFVKTCNVGSTAQWLDIAANLLDDSIWVTRVTDGTVTKLDTNGDVVETSANIHANGVTVDSLGNTWIASKDTINNVYKLNSDATIAETYEISTDALVPLFFITTDSSNDVWVTVAISGSFENGEVVKLTF